MQLYLMQHGQAVPETENPEQPLSREGVATVRTSAAAMKTLGLSFDLIVCSPKKRSHQSAALVAEGVNYPYSDIAETDSLKPTAPPEAALAFLRRHAGWERVLVAGHLPSLTEIAALLLGAKVRLRFEHGGLSRLDMAELAPGAAELAWHLPSAALRLLAE